MNVRLIKGETDYHAAMARLSELMLRDPKPGAAEANELELLALVIEDYERKIVPPAQPDPVDAILFRMDQMKLTRKDLVSYVGSISKVSEILSRKRPLSLSMIRRLHQGLGIPAEVLIGNREPTSDTLDEPDLDYSKFPLSEMHARGCLGEIKGSTKKLQDYAEEPIRRLMKEIFPDRTSPAFLRAPLHQRGSRVADEYALLAWRMCVIKKARAIERTHEFKPSAITPKWLQHLAKLSAFDDGPKLAKEHLARHGIALVIEPHFQKTFLDGAAMLDGKHPIVALTLRHDRLDNFWFALLHELVHVGWHLTERTPFFSDDLDNHSKLDNIEKEADEIATEALIPADAWAKSAVRSTHSGSDARALAHKLGIHPSIVAGRVRHETRNYRILTQLIGRGGQLKEFFP
ncbi:MAG: ImmA/IrrE family metallo-endopeptidase [Gammaproteobacteria bacterium]|nr:ImmA/IrrE family metallo-endopeptidase [Gammaproteobacteria bacterium]